MKKYLAALGVFFALCACTEESKVKKVAVEAAQNQFQSMLRQELAQGVQGKPLLQETAVKVLATQTEFAVQNVRIEGDRAEVLIHALTVPVKAREALVEIMNKLEPNRVDRFNVSNALQLIRQQMGISQTQSVLSYKIDLRKKKEWQVLETGP